MGPDVIVHALKDERAAHPVATAWRPAFRGIVGAFAARDYALERGVESVAPVPPSTADSVKAYIKDYGETLTDLPEETWTTSVSQWMSTHWDVLVDLWTVESGCSDMVLHARVFEAGESFRVEVYLVYVP
jgi:hypothetical protein